MKTYQDYINQLKELEHFFGFDPSAIDQTSPEWHKIRLGVITASRAECLIKKKHGSKGFEYGVDYLPSSSKESKWGTYLLELCASVATAMIPDDINARPLLWGRENEEPAREAYEVATLTSIKELPFIFKDNKMRAGISVDGLNDDGVGGLELKCPYSPKVMIEFMANDVIKHEYRHQCQFSMWITGREYWDFANFDPRMVNAKKLHYTRINRCEKAMKIFDESYELFVSDMDAMLKKIGAEFGQQWSV